MIVNVVLILTLKTVIHYLLIYTYSHYRAWRGEVQHVAHSIVLTVLSTVQDFKFCRGRGRFSADLLPVKVRLCLLIGYNYTSLPLSLQVTK